MSFQDLLSFSTITDPQIHPRGGRVLFVVSRMDFDEDRYHRSIWLWDGDDARPFTHGPADSRPRWSPDGTQVAFLRSAGGEGDKAQVAVMPVSGGEARVLTDFDLGAAEAEWSPDGGELAVIGIAWRAEWADLDDDERTRRPRRITGAGFRFDNQGWRHDRRRNVYLVDPAGGDTRALTEGDHLDSGVCWRPDGGAVAFMSPRHDRAHFDFGSQAWEIDASGGDPSALTAIGHWDSISYRPDGVAHVVGIPEVWGYPDVAGLYRLEGGEPVRLAADLDRSFAPPSPPLAPGGPQWLADGSCRCVIDDRGISRVIEVATDGSWQDLAGGRRMITGMTATADGAQMAFAATSVTDPGELHLWEAGSERTLTAINAAYRDGAGLVEPTHLEVDRGDLDLDVWVFVPEGEGPFPVLLNIHGGPATQYGWGFFDEFHAYVQAGYAVVACNPRGSSGRGRDFVRAPVGRWVEDRPVDLEDVVASFEAALDGDDRLDRERLGIMGGSYGGFLTSRIIAVDHRFRSAVPERGLYVFTSFAGTSDIGLRFPRVYLGEWGHDDWSDLWEASPISRAHRITTPCLIIHAENDHRCPIEQGEQLFSVLLEHGVEAELLRFPDSSHELSRSGKPTYRIERFEAIVEWHGRHM